MKPRISEELKKEHKRKYQEKYYREWYARNGRSRPENYVEQIKEWVYTHPVEIKAHWLLTYAVRSGKIIKPSVCSNCGRKVRLSGHHKDYSKPYEVVWLCSSCHKLEHIEPPIDKG